MLSDRGLWPNLIVDRALFNCRRQPGSSLILDHEGVAFLGRYHVLDIVELATAAFIDDVEKAERTRAAVAQDLSEIGSKELFVISPQRCLIHAMLQHGRTKVHASMMAWLGPLEPVGYIADAALPMSATEPS